MPDMQHDKAGRGAEGSRKRRKQSPRRNGRERTGHEDASLREMGRDTGYPALNHSSFFRESPRASHALAVNVVSFNI